MKNVDGLGSWTVTMKAAVLLYGAAAIATGIVDLIWGAFDSAHEPIQTFGDNLPVQRTLAYIVAVLLICGGAALFSRRSARYGAAVLATVYVAFAVFWLPRFHTAPLFLGSTPFIYIGVLGGVCQQLIVVCAAVFVCASLSEPNSRWDLATIGARWIFGASSIDFGLQHLMGVADNTAYVPPWIPFGPDFWVVLTGTAFVLAGVAILSRILDVLAARLLALMFFAFSALTLIPGLFLAPHDQVNWGGNTYNLIAVASAWILGEWLAVRRPQDAKARRPLQQ